MPGLFESRVILYNMKYSILGFNQQDVLGITKDVIVEQSNGDYPKTKTLKLDCIDLLILQDVADFMNRRKIIKYTVDDKIYFSIQYSAIIEDLPILGIKKQALSDRLSKLVELEMLEKVVIKNQAGSFVAFRLGEKYESIKYKPSESKIGTSSTLHLQEYSDTFAEVADYAPKYSSTNNSSTNTKKEERDKSLSKKSFDFLSALLSIGVEEQIAKDWMKIRTSKKASDSETAFKQLKTALESINNTYGISATDAIGICVTNGWYGCKPSYFENIRLDDYGFGTQTSLSQQNNGKDWQ